MKNENDRRPRALNCAYCNSEPSVYLVDGAYRVCCENPNCPTNPGTSYYDSEETAVMVWNTRGKAAAGDLGALMKDEFRPYVNFALYDSMIEDLHEEYLGVKSSHEIAECKKKLLNFLHGTKRHESEDDETIEDISTPEKNEEPDMVDHPSHYDKNGVECIDWIRTMLTPEEYRGYLKGNVLKYVWRHEDKGKPVQDLEKTRKYIDFLIEEWQVRR